ncbi:hypothetical protein AVEN_36639-1 [Araneus ventricosus]|uniref:Uncharacterized protein n=1 Tax=Araneus ventricosus TaxID=182803 RepID=A0A4Y2FXW8_ARAVE|nr:hypothetical protein AVEN_36639-1 [Araneus ventricosus]
MTPRVSPFVTQTSYFVWLIRSVLYFSFRIEVFTCFSQCRHHMKNIWSVYVNFLLDLKLMKIQTEDTEDNGPDDVLEENFSDHESLSEHDTELEEDRDSGNEEGNISE